MSRSGRYPNMKRAVITCYGAARSTTMSSVSALPAAHGMIPTPVAERLASVAPARTRAVFRKYGVKIGLPELASHDLRRTFAQLGYEAGVPIAQISILLGHSALPLLKGIRT